MTSLGLDAARSQFLALMNARATSPTATLASVAMPGGTLASTFSFISPGSAQAAQLGQLLAPITEQGPAVFHYGRKGGSILSRPHTAGNPEMHITTRGTGRSIEGAHIKVRNALRSAFDINLEGSALQQILAQTYP